MGEGFYIAWFSPSDVTAFHRIGLYSYRMTSRVLYGAQYHRQHCALEAFEQFRELYMHNLDDTHIKLLIEKRFFFYLIYQYIYISYCTIVSKPIHKSKGDLKTGLFVYIMTVMQVDSSDKPSF